MLRALRMRSERDSIRDHDLYDDDLWRRDAP